MDYLRVGGFFGMVGNKVNAVRDIRDSKDLQKILTTLNYSVY